MTPGQGVATGNANLGLPAVMFTSVVCNEVFHGSTGRGQQILGRNRHMARQHEPVDPVGAEALLGIEVASP
jgi:hypothetical protein